MKQNKLNFFYFLLALVLASSKASFSQQRLIATEEKALVTFNVINLDSVPQSGVRVVYKSTDKKINGEGITNDEGLFSVLMPEGRTFRISIKKEKNIDFGMFKVPQVVGPLNLTQTLRYNVINEKITNNEVSSGLLVANDQTSLVNFKVTDYDSIPEQGAIIKCLAEDKKTKYEGVCNEEGSFDVLLPEGKSYTVSVEKFGKKFDFGELRIPSVDGPLQFSQLYRIRVITNYIEKFILKNIFFETGKADLKKTSFPALNDLYQSMKANPKLKIEVAGHTDNVGSEEANMKLSQNRANTIRKYLNGRGITIDRVTSKGYGEKDPLEDNATEEGRQKNRRLEVRVIEH